MLRFLPLIFILLWSSAFISGKVIVQDASPFAALSFRFALVTIGFFSYSLIKKEKIIAPFKYLFESISTGVLFHGVYLGGCWYAFSIGMPAAIVALIVTFQEAQRRIPVQYSRSQVKGGRVYRQQGQSYLPLRVNTAGMIPLIFAFSIMIFPPVAAQFLANTVDVGWIASVAGFIQSIMSPAAFPYWILVFILVVLFTFFYTMVVFQQQNLADNLQKQGGFIPGIRPGLPTQQYINRVLVRITWGGAIFLGFIAVVPFLATSITNVQALQIGAAGLLIVVGVVIDTMRQLEAQMSMRNYEGFM